MNFTTVHLDDDLIVVNKPSGILCVPGLSSDQNLYDGVRASHPNARVVHRLDMATSGLVMFALNHPSQVALGKQFEQRKVRKKYRALIHGCLKENSGEIFSKIICDWDKRPKQKICWLSGKSALTYYERVSVDHFKNISEVSLFPSTGRTHQLRMHMLQIGHPILGDALYSQGFEGDFPKANAEVSAMSANLFLHAEELEFSHPRTGKQLQLKLQANFSAKLETFSKTTIDQN